MKIDYTIITPSVMKVLVDGKKELLILGEATLTPVFYAYKNSIKSWEPPFETIPLTAIEITEIIRQIQKISRTREVKVIFE